MKHLSTILFALLLTNISLAAASYDWASAPDPLVELSEEEQKEHSVYLKDFNKIVLSYNDKTGALEQRTIRHYIVRVNTTKGIERFNQVYIGVEDAKLIEAKARVIRKDGKVSELNKSAIREATESESGVPYKYFAVEGAEEGCNIEVLYIVEKSPSLNGVRHNVQAGSPIKDYHFELVSPSNLFWGFKLYNELPEIEHDTTDKKINRYVLKVQDIQPLYDEKYTFSDINKKFLVYRLEANAANRLSNLTSFVDVSNNIYQNMTGPLGKAALKQYAALVKTLQLKEGDVLGNVRKLENYMKQNYQVVENGQPSFNAADFLLENKVGNENAFHRLFIHFLKDQKIPFEIGMTCDRSENIFDANFEAYYVLRNFFLYLPGEDTYIAPAEMDSRVGFLPALWTDNYGLFIRPVSLGGVVKGVGKVSYIPAKPSSDSEDKLDIKLTISEDFSKVNAKIHKKATGYIAYLQPYYYMVPADGQKNLIEELVKIGGQEDVVKSYEVKNYQVEDVFVKPFVISAEVESENLMERAGNKYIFKIGSVIGQQVEMYQERKRVQPVQVSFTHDYYRDIQLEIPQGYRVKNYENLARDIRYDKDGKDVFGWISTVKHEDNKLIISIKEYYDFTSLPIDVYEVFESVVNAAADFYESSIQLEKI